MNKIMHVWNSEEARPSLLAEEAGFSITRVLIEMNLKA